MMRFLAVAGNSCLAIRSLIVFLTKLPGRLTLSPDGGASIRRTMNIHQGNHGNETSRKAVLSFHECH